MRDGVTLVFCVALMHYLLVRKISAISTANFGVLADDRVSPDLIKLALNQIWEEDVSYNEETEEMNFVSIVNMNTNIEPVNPRDPTDLLNKVCVVASSSPLFVLFFTECAKNSGLRYLTSAINLPVIQIQITTESQCKQRKPEIYFQTASESGQRNFLDVERFIPQTNSTFVRRRRRRSKLRGDLSSLHFHQSRVETKVYWNLEEQNLVGQFFSSLDWTNLVCLYDFSFDFRSLQNVLEQLGSRMQYTTVQKLPVNRKDGFFAVKSSQILIETLLKKATLQCSQKRNKMSSPSITVALFCGEFTARKFILELSSHFHELDGIHYYIVDIGWASNLAKSVIFSREFTIITKPSIHSSRQTIDFDKSVKKLKEKLKVTLTAATKAFLRLNSTNSQFETSRGSCMRRPLRTNYQSKSFISHLEDILQERTNSVQKVGFDKSSHSDDAETFLNTEVTKSFQADKKNQMTDEMKACGMTEKGKVICKSLRSLIASNMNKNNSPPPYTTFMTENKKSSTSINTHANEHSTHPYGVLLNRTFRVATIEDPPFVFIKYNQGIPHFSGFSIDLLDALSHLGGFQYNLYEVSDRKYGSLNNGTWSGLVGDLIAKKCDLAISAMTITPQREQVLDFTKRYMDYAVGLLMKSSRTSTNLFAFLNPFSKNVWYSIIGGWILVSCLLYVLNRASPGQGCIPEFHDRSLIGTFWFVYSTLVQQGTGMHITAVSAQVVTGVWWFFVLIIVSSYTANLAAHLTVSRMDGDIKSFTELSMQKDITYGTVHDTSIYDFLRTKGLDENEDMAMWDRIWHMINGSNSVSVAEEGINRVKNSNGDYAFLWDVAIIEYLVLNSPTCSLRTIPDSLFSKGYVIAVQDGDPIKDALSLGILQLQDLGDLEILRMRWWTKQDSCQLNNRQPNNISRDLSLESFAGVFCILAGGLVIASLVALCEICSNAKKYKLRKQCKTFDTEGKEKKQQNDAESNTATQHPLVTFEKSSDNELHIVVKGIAGAVCKQEKYYKALKKHYNTWYPKKYATNSLSRSLDAASVSEEMEQLTSEDKPECHKKNGHVATLAYE